MQVTVHTSTPPVPADLTLDSGEGTPDAIATRGAPWLLLRINPISGTYDLALWVYSDDGWSVLDQLAIDANENPQPYVKVYRINAAVKFAAVSALNQQTQPGEGEDPTPVPVPGSSFDGEDNPQVFLEAAYG